MTDNDLIRIIITLIIYKLPSYGYNDVTVKQSQQPTLQGANTNPTIYFYKLFDRRYGWTKRESKWDPDELTMTNTESQMYETTFQMGGMVRQIPSNPYGHTASDLVNTVAAIMQNDQTLLALAGHNLGILRVTDVRNPYFKDDRDQFAAFPSFDFTITHRQTRVTVESVIESINYKIYRV